ncbi:hypothetical protein BMJ28_23760 [Sinorhizobium medicae]|nr:hypothetical protein BMJ31_17520 [Sinorhizobium medicae]PLU30767.1 hypothetical protein BMJ28_23760 [Sinorhizobium medicae]
MDDGLIAECTAKAPTAFKRSIIITSITAVVFLAFAIDWISLYVVYPSTQVVVWSDFPQWMFPTKTAVVATLFVVCTVSALLDTRPSNVLWRPRRRKTRIHSLC